MNQNIWGSHLWFSLHSISFNYPLFPTIDDKNNYKNFFLSLKETIPCSICKKNYKRHIIEHPIDNFLDNRKKLVYWVIDIHNMVNSEIGKKILSYDNVIKKYESVYNKKIKLYDGDDIKNDINYNNKDNVKIIHSIFIFFILLLIINFIIFFYTK